MGAEPAGWRPDPSGEHQYRYWDGEQWTDRVTDDAVASTTRDPTATDRDATRPSWPEPGPPASLGGNGGTVPVPGSEPERSAVLGGAPGGPTTGAATPAAAAGRQVARVVRKAPTARLLVAIGAGAAAVIAAVVVVVLGSGGGSANDDAEHADNQRDVAETPADRADEGLRDVIHTAVHELESARTFTFEAAVSVSLPPGAFATVDRIQLEGVVRLPDSIRQRAHSTTYAQLGTEERVVIADEAWRRGSVFPESLDDVPWIAEGVLGEVSSLRPGAVQSPLESLPEVLAATHIPQWLESATDLQEGGTDEGHRVLTGQVAQVPVVIRPDVTRLELHEGTVRLTVDHRGRPLRVSLSATLDGDRANATYDLEAIGDPVTIEEPETGELDPLPIVQEHDIAVAASQLVAPIGLTSPADGWQLVDARVSDFSQEAVEACTYINVSYRSSSGAWLHISGTRPTSVCRPFRRGGAPFTAGDHVGNVTDLGIRAGTIDIGFGPVNVADATLVDFDVAGMMVSVFAADVPDADLARVLATLGPIDPTEQAERIDPPQPDA